MEDKLSKLKLIAKEQGIEFSGNIGFEALTKKIEEATDKVEITKAKLTPNQIREELKKKSNKIRVQVQCLNPDKSQVPGEIFSLQNRYMKKLSQYIPYGEVTENGYHVYEIIVDHLKSRKFMSKSKKKPRGQNGIQKGKLLNEFAITVLPPLTQKELDELALKQQAAERTETKD